jgi:murein DD-endopeptidase MepM/ murein hydrolase activator NlpD
MPSNALATAAFLVLAPTVALTTVPALREAPEPLTRPQAQATSGTAPPGPSTDARPEAAGPARPAVPAPWIWPLSPGPPVMRGFTVGPYRWSPGHRGVDLATRSGARVRAPAAGVVSFADTVVGRRVLVITHDDGVRTAYEPVASTVRAGSRVDRGAAVGTVTDAPDHCPRHTCVHWSVRRGDRYLDPLTFLRPRRVALLPLPRGSPRATG